MIDVSHLNERGFWDVARLSSAPLIAMAWIWSTRVAMPTPPLARPSSRFRAASCSRILRWALGCVQRFGQSYLVAGLRYREVIHRRVLRPGHQGEHTALQTSI
jgi:Membrane dipeptidase (Peptidase family M19)